MVVGLAASVTALVLLPAACMGLLTPAAPDKPAAPLPPGAGVRDACRQFIVQRHVTPRDHDFGPYWDWPVTQTGDSFRVLASFHLNGRPRALVCHIKDEGKDYRLRELVNVQ